MGGGRAGLRLDRDSVGEVIPRAEELLGEGNTPESGGRIVQRDEGESTYRVHRRQLRAITTARLTSRFGVIDPDRLKSIDQALRFILDV
jgi:hypothetical protein